MQKHFWRAVSRGISPQGTTPDGRAIRDATADEAVESVLSGPEGWILVDFTGEVDSDGDCLECGSPANNSSGSGHCEHPCHRGSIRCYVTE